VHAAGLATRTGAGPVHRRLRRSRGDGPVTRPWGGRAGLRRARRHHGAHRRRSARGRAARRGLTLVSTEPARESARRFQTGPP
jgi:hypothetical protein